MTKSLDMKLANFRTRKASTKDFVLADAKDADMAFGLLSTGTDTQRLGAGQARSLTDYRDRMREIVRQGLVDITLMSVSSSEKLTIEERLFDSSYVTPAVRVNDTTDIHFIRGGRYSEFPSMPFRSMTIDQAQCGKAQCAPDERRLGVDLGLYSITFNNDPERDRTSLKSYREFRIEAESKGFRHFLEVFNPNVPNAVPPGGIGNFVNDQIARLLAGVPRAGRPLFLKIPYNGPRYMEELAAYDSDLVVGVLGGAAGTTYDAFKLLAEAKQYGARAALFGRKINAAEDQLAFVHLLRRIADGDISPEEAVSAYHADLKSHGIHPHRSLNEDLEPTHRLTS